MSCRLLMAILPPSTSDDVLDDARQREHGRRSASDSFSTASQARRDLASSLQTRGVTSSSTIGWQPKLERFLFLLLLHLAETQ